jgi:hypothetical protein
MRRAVVIAKIVLRACAGLMAIMVILSWVAPGGCPAMVCSAFLLWRESRDNRRELRAARRESRDVSFEEGAEWTSKVRFYVLAFFLSLSWYVLPPAPFLHLSRSHGPPGEASTGSGPWRARARSGPVTGSAWEGMLRPRACELGQGTWGGRVGVRGLG